MFLAPFESGNANANTELDGGLTRFNQAKEVCGYDNG